MIERSTSDSPVIAGIDRETGIRYGCISQSSVLQAWADSAEADYGKPTCPKCGNEIVEYNGDDHNEYELYHDRSLADYACTSCEVIYESQDAFGDGPQGWVLDDGEYKAEDCLDSAIILLKSPYYTFARFCSPCVPGAGDLDNADESGVKAYCFSHDWFDDGVAPYPVYSVETGEVVDAETW